MEKYLVLGSVVDVGLNVEVSDPSVDENFTSDNEIRLEPFDVL